LVLSILSFFINLNSKMNNKLEYLAQKEEELRRLNEQLEKKNQNILNKKYSPEKEQQEEAPLDDSLGQEAPPEENKEEEVKMKEDSEFDQAIGEVERYREVLEKNKELEKTVAF